MATPSSHQDNEHHNRRSTDPMIIELIGKVDSLDRKLDDHMAEEVGHLSDIADNKQRVDELHSKMDQLLDFAQVWNDLKGLGRLTAKLTRFIKWVGGLAAAGAAIWTAIQQWPDN